MKTTNEAPKSLGFIKTETATQTVVWSTIISGLLDATAGVIVYFALLGLNPIQVLQFIASGALGTKSYELGLLGALAGLVFHFIIAFAFAYGFFKVYPLIPLLAKNTLVTGLLYGLGIWLFMNLLVLPNSSIPAATFNPLKAGLEIAWHMALVGYPIAYITARYYNSKK